MKCPGCGMIDHDCKVTDSRPFKNTIKRSRKCSICGHRWKTYEVTESDYYYDFCNQSNKRINQRWSENEIKTLIALKESGKTNQDIADLLGRKKNSVALRIFKLNESGEYFEILDELEEGGQQIATILKSMQTRTG